MGQKVLKGWVRVAVLYGEPLSCWASHTKAVDKGETCYPHPSAGDLEAWLESAWLVNTAAWNFQMPKHNTKRIEYEVIEAD